MTLFEDQDALAQEVVDTWGLHTQAGNASLLTAEFLDVFEKACRYRDGKRLAESYRSRNALSEEDARAQETAEQTFIEAYKAWADRHTS